MDFAKLLASDSISQHATVALCLRAERANGFPFVPALLERCQNVCLDTAEVTKFEETLVGFGCMSIGAVVHAAGLDPASELYRRVLDWTSELATYRHVAIAAYAIYGLGELGAPLERVRNRLLEIVTSPRRLEDNRVITCRGIAFRILARIDQDAARKLIASPACREYVDAVRYWMKDNSSRGLACSELEAEIEWITAARDVPL